MSGTDDAAGPDSSPDGRFDRPRRLHPLSVLLGMDLRRLVQAYLLPIFATFAVAGLTVTVAVAIVVAVVTIRVAEWRRFRFCFDGTTLHVDEGVIRRDHRAVDVARMQQVSVDRTVAQRVFGLATLRVETAGGSGDASTIELRVLPEEDVEALRAAVVRGGARVGDVPATDAEAAAVGEREVLHVPLRHVVLGAVTGARLLVFPALLLGLTQFLDQLPRRWLDLLLRLARGEGLVVEGDELVLLTVRGAVVLGAAIIVLSVLSAVAVAVVRDARYRIDRSGDELSVSRGLLATRTAVMPLRRVQQLEVRANAVRRLLGYATVRIDSAGGSGSDDRRVAVPLLPAGQAEALLREVFPRADGLPELTGHPDAARRRAVLRWLRLLVPVAAGPWLLTALWESGWLAALRVPALVLVPLAGALGVIEHRLLAHGVSAKLVAARRGVLAVRTSVAPLVKIQAASRRDDPFQRRLELATVVAHVAGPGGDVVIIDLAAADAQALRATLTEHGAVPSRRSAPDG